MHNLSPLLMGILITVMLTFAVYLTLIPYSLCCAQYSHMSLFFVLFFYDSNEGPSVSFDLFIFGLLVCFFFFTEV